MLACIKCGRLATDVRLSVGVDTGVIQCDGCDEEYTADDVRALIAGWGPVLAWLDIRSTPVRDANANAKAAAVFRETADRT